MRKKLQSISGSIVAENLLALTVIGLTVIMSLSALSHTLSVLAERM